MNDLMTVTLRWTVRIFLLVVATVFFLSLLAAASLLAVVWGARAVWAKITGRAVTPWVMGVNPAAAWSSVYRAGGSGSASSAARSSAAQQGDSRSAKKRYVSDDVIDVQPREVQ